MDPKKFANEYVVVPLVMLRDAQMLGITLVLIWIAFPVAVQTMIHPSDVVGVQAYMQDMPIPRYMTVKSWFTCEFIAVIFAALLGISQFVTLLYIYRLLQYVAPVWVAALIIVGGIDSVVWLVATGYFDLIGVLANFGPVAIMIVAEMALEKAGADFVFGKGVRPKSPKGQ